MGTENRRSGSDGPLVSTGPEIVSFPTPRTLYPLLPFTLSIFRLLHHISSYIMTAKPLIVTPNCHAGFFFPFFFFPRPFSLIIS